MKLLKNKEDFEAWRNDIFETYRKIKQPELYPCYAYPVVSSWGMQEYDPVYIYADDLRNMLASIESAKHSVQSDWDNKLPCPECNGADGHSLNCSFAKMPTPDDGHVPVKKVRDAVAFARHWMLESSLVPQPEIKRELVITYLNLIERSLETPTAGKK